MNDMRSPQPALLKVRGLTVGYGATTAVRDVSFCLQPGEALGIVGESGSGKSSIAGAILNCLDPSARVQGEILFEGRELLRLPRAARRAVLGRKIGSVFQDPFTSLNPALRIGRQIAEPIVQHLGVKPYEAGQRAVHLLREMGIHRADEVARAFPHQLSGGMKQRALIAAALACEAPLLILDEPTTALDVTVEAQILRLLADLRERRGVSLLFISHNLAVVRRLCDSVAVMYASQLVELGSVGTVLERPLHPYSKGLLASRPPLRAASRGNRLPAIDGQMPNAPAPEAGCVFAPRCPYAEEHCGVVQSLTEVRPGHLARCWKACSVGDWPRFGVEAIDQGPFRAGDALVNVTQLRKTFTARRGLGSLRLMLRGGRPRLRHQPGQVMAVDGVSLAISPGEVLGLVGESGCGKSTLGRLALRLLNPSEGSVEFDGADLGRLGRTDLAAFRKHAQIVFQNVGSSLNPRLSVGEAIERPLALFGLVRPRERQRRVEELLEMVRLSPSYRLRYPHQLSGGERQRVAIARALATEPRFIVCDEPVSALDFSVQAAVINLLADLRDQFGLAYLFISHDLAVVAQLADRIAVMYDGRICESGTPAELLEAPHHPYTRMLLAAVRDNGVTPELPTGDVLKPRTTGCPFITRCPHSVPSVCQATPPLLRSVGTSHQVACHFDPVFPTAFARGAHAIGSEPV
jgi:peptide/nickel transport system ATP-binding protein